MYKSIISSKPLHKHPNLKFMLHSWKKEEKAGTMLATQKAINMEVPGILSQITSANGSFQPIPSCF
jgi:hypothetical protein